MMALGLTFVAAVVMVTVRVRWVRACTRTEQRVNALIRVNR